jgi:hypothetical protein
MQHLTCAGTELEDDYTLDDYEITQDSALLLAVS